MIKKNKKTILKFVFFIFFYIFLPIFGSLILFFFNNKHIIAIKEVIPIFLTVYDRNKIILKNIDEPIQFNKIPSSLVHAFISTEDTGFFLHFGFSIKSMIRSFLFNLKKKKLAQGGSTITQQLVKLYLGDLRKTFSRKIKELIIAIMIEICFTKEEIFEAYCNILNFGKNIFGVSAAANTFFNKSYKKLSIDESALLAGIVQLPEYYNPIQNKKNALKRRNIVLHKMYLEGYLTKKKYQEYISKETIIHNNSTIEINKPINAIIKSILKKNNLPINNEYTVFTTIDSKIQTIIYQIFKKKIKKLINQCEKIEGSVIIVDYKKNQVVAIAENKKNFEENIYTEKKYIGSIIKPFITYFAFLNHDTENTMYSDTPLEDYFNYNPQNHYKKYLGEISIRESLIKSNNIVPIRILKKYSIDNFIKIIQDFFSTDIKPFWSLALGCIPASAFEVASIYSSFFNPLNDCFPRFIEKIIQKAAGIVYEEPTKIISTKFDTEKVEAVKLILAKTGESFKKKYNISTRKPIYVKTGTTNGSINCWTMCANDQYCVIAYLGTRENIPLFKKHRIIAANSTLPLALEILLAIS